jgi:hypothetical protein
MSTNVLLAITNVTPTLPAVIIQAVMNAHVMLVLLVTVKTAPTFKNVWQIWTTAPNMQHVPMSREASHVNARMVSLAMELNVTTTTNVLAIHVMQTQTAKIQSGDSLVAARLDSAAMATIVMT